MGRFNAAPRNPSDRGDDSVARRLGRHAIGYVVAVLAGATIALGIERVYGDWPPPTHRLEQPLIIGGGPGQTAALLPAGTSLYFDQAFPEGFVRYKVYVNVEGVRLESHESQEKFWLSPLSARPVDGEQLRKLLRDYPLSRDDLAAILEHSPVTREEIRELLAEYE